VWRRLLSLVLGPSPKGRSILGDLEEEHAERATINRTEADRWFRREAVGVLLRRPGDSLMRRFTHDFVEAARALGKQPRFLAVTTLTVALGIAAVTTTFSIVNGVLLRPLPHPDADRLVNVWSNAPGLNYDEFPVSPEIFYFYRAHNTVFEDMAISQPGRANLADDREPEVADVARTTYSYFATLGVSFVHGRSYAAADDRPDSARVAVLSHRLWIRRYGGDPSIIGRTIRIDGNPTVVLGVTAAWADSEGAPELWIPARFNPENPQSGAFSWYAVARLKPGVEPVAAVTELGGLVQRALKEFIQGENYRAFLTEGRYRPLVRPMRDDLVGSVREPLWILSATVAMVLLVACANVANLFLIRGEARRREMAVRVALGGSRARLVSKLGAEALVVALVGGVVGAAIASLAQPALLSLAPGTIPRLDQVRIDVTVLAVAGAASVLSALLFGLAPAIRFSRPSVLTSLRSGDRIATESRGRRRVRSALVVAQTATALVLLVGAGLLARSFERLMDADIGFVPDHVLTFRVSLPVATFPSTADVVRVGQELADRLSELPGAEAAAAATALPFSVFPEGTVFEFEGRPIDPGRLPPIVHNQVVTSEYFEALRIPVLRGRYFNTGDRRADIRSAIVDKSLADQFWPGQDPVGKRLRVGERQPDREMPWFTVVGVVQPVRQGDRRDAPRPQIYFPLNTSNERLPRTWAYVIRGPRAASETDAIRRTVSAVHRDLPISAVETMETIVQRSMAQFSFTLLTLSIAAATTLLLGMVGLYGVLSYAVGLRTREIGVRLALGAVPGQVMRSVVVDGAELVAAGLVVGAAAAAGLARFLGNLLFEVKPFDLATFTTMPLVLFAVALIAAYLPARTAARVSPLEAMKTD
jgi:putative ABC transport system permease protein